MAEVLDQRAPAHTLKGSSLNPGAAQVAELAQRIEALDGGLTA